MTLEERIHQAEADLFHAVGAKVDESFLRPRQHQLARAVAGSRQRPATGSAPRRFAQRCRVGAPIYCAPGPQTARDRPSRSRALRPRLLSTWSRSPERTSADRGHPRRTRTPRSARRRPLAGRDARALVCGNWRPADLKSGRDRRARGRAPRRPRTDAAVAADGPRPRGGYLAISQPSSCLSTPARPGPRPSGGRRRTGLAYRRAAPIRPSTGERENCDLADARDRPLPTASGRERPHHPAARRDLNTHHVHLGHRRSVPLREPCPAVDRPDPQRDASRSPRSARPLARRHQAQRGANPKRTSPAPRPGSDCPAARHSNPDIRAVARSGPAPHTAAPYLQSGGSSPTRRSRRATPSGWR